MSAFNDFIAYAYGGVWETWADAPHARGELPPGYRAEFSRPQRAEDRS